jgi:hypothetical protein
MHLAILKIITILEERKILWYFNKHPNSAIVRAIDGYLIIHNGDKFQSFTLANITHQKWILTVIMICCRK